MGKRIRKDSRHLRWNWRESPESSEDSKKVRYYFDVVDDKFREGKIFKILSELEKLSIINFSFDEIQRLEGKVGNSKLKYLCKVYDSDCSPNLVGKAVKHIFGSNVVMDENLYDRVKSGTSLEKYLENLHS